jgi:hypothetical protein
VTWTLDAFEQRDHAADGAGGFRPDQEQAYQGAKFGWPRYFNTLEELAAKEFA